jgi:hypothetical protein
MIVDATLTEVRAILAAMRQVAATGNAGGITATDRATIEAASRYIFDATLSLLQS